MRDRFWLFLAVAAGIAMLPAPCQAKESPLGQWLTADHDGVIAIAPCGENLCGTIVGMQERADAAGAVPHDQSGQPQCGLVILRDGRESQAGLWQARITNPDTGSIWKCEFWLEADGLHLRGYVMTPLLGQTQTWTRYTGRIGADCLMN